MYKPSFALQQRLKKRAPEPGLMWVIMGTDIQTGLNHYACRQCGQPGEHHPSNIRHSPACPHYVDGWQ